MAARITDQSFGGCRQLRVDHSVSSAEEPHILECAEYDNVE